MDFGEFLVIMAIVLGIFSVLLVLPVTLVVLSVKPASRNS